MIIENSINNSENLYKIKYLKYKKKYLDLKVMQEGGNCIKWTDVINLVENHTKIKSKVKSKDTITINSITATIIYALLEINITKINLFIDSNNHYILHIDAIINIFKKIIKATPNINTSFKTICINIGRTSSKSSQIKAYYNCLNNLIYHYLYTQTDGKLINNDKTNTIYDQKIIQDMQTLSNPIIGNYAGKFGDRFSIKQNLGNMGANFLSSIGSQIAATVTYGPTYGHTTTLNIVTLKEKDLILETFNNFIEKLQNTGVIYKDLIKIKNISIYNISIKTESSTCKLSDQEINIINIIKIYLPKMK